MADAWPSPDASSTPKIKPERTSKSSRSAANGKRVARETPRQDHPAAEEAAGGGQERSNSPKVKPEKLSEKKPVVKTVSDDDEESNDDAPKGRKRLRRMDGQPRRSEAPDIDEEDETEARPTTKIFVRDSKDG